MLSLGIDVHGFITRQMSTTIQATVHGYIVPVHNYFFVLY